MKKGEHNMVAFVYTDAISSKKYMLIHFRSIFCIRKTNKSRIPT